MTGEPRHLYVDPDSILDGLPIFDRDGQRHPAGRNPRTEGITPV